MSDPTRWQDFELHRRAVAYCNDCDVRGVPRGGRRAVMKALGVSLEVLKRLEKKSRLKTNGLIPIGPGPGGYSMTPEDVYVTYTGYCNTSRVATAKALLGALEGADERYPRVGAKMVGLIADADKDDPTLLVVQERLSRLSRARQRGFAEKVWRANVAAQGDAPHNPPSYE